MKTCSPGRIRPGLRAKRAMTTACSEENAHELNQNPAPLRSAGGRMRPPLHKPWCWRRETNYVGRLSLSVAVAFAGCKLSLVIA